MNPNVFLSHARKDKVRFVVDFATRLRDKGINVWLDKWEILPGDSLVDKIFEEGIKDAQAIIVVVSENSVNSPWVEEELNASVVKKINGLSKLIPVVLDNCEVPQSLQSTVWVRIEDLTNYDKEFDSIVAAIYEHREKPPLGQPPAYTRTQLEEIPNLTRVDNLILKLVCECAIERGHRYVLDVQEIIDRAIAFDVPRSEVIESLQMLHEQLFIEPHFAIGGDLPFPSFTITLYGFDEYARAYVHDWRTFSESVALQLINFERKDNTSIIAALNRPQMLVDHVLNVFTQNGWIKAEEYNEGLIYIFEVSTKLKRKLKQA
ncbi:MAG TPA: toll/interleukin-1 receptor domain-containing protein [Pyrinomonadaceae bacterium]|jgi:hypothetical protein|nr:toll/interleukin-1 receptor domain-containing protein [Pyrinomonadaceae bacterium]